jgi:hypothetical protein
MKCAVWLYVKQYDMKCAVWLNVKLRIYWRKVELE